MSSKYEIFRVKKDTLPDGVYIREEGTSTWLLRLNPKAFFDKDDEENCAALIADFLTNVQMWSS